MAAGGFGRNPAPISNRRTAIINANKNRDLDDLFSVSFNAKDILHLMEKESRRYREPKFYDALKRANERAAVTIQKGMRDELRSKIGDRPQRPGKRLEKSIMSEQNRSVFPNTFMVGIEAWMNKSPAALYWRQIEEGMGGYTARVLFTNTGGAEGQVGPRWFAPGDGMQLRMGQFKRGGGRLRGVEVHFKRTVGKDYSGGGKDAFDRLDMADLYIRTLRNAGFKNISRDTKGLFR